MLKVEEYGRIRRAHRDGMSIREIARTYGHSRRKIREALAEAEPRPYTLSQPRPRRVLTAAHQQWIDAILIEDEQTDQQRLGSMEASTQRSSSNTSRGNAKGARYR